MTATSRRTAKSRRRPRPARHPDSRTGRLNDYSSLIFGLIAVVALIGIGLAVRNRVQSPTPGNSDRELTDTAEAGSVRMTAEGLLQEMLAAYRNANAYADKTSMRATMIQPSRTVERRATIEVHFEKPNRIRLAISQPNDGLDIDIRSDGTHMQTRVGDPSTRDFDGQVVELPAPRQMTTAELLTATECVNPMQPETLFNLLMDLPAQPQVSQLSLLMDDDPLGGLLKSAQARKRLADQTLDGQLCHRVQVTVASGDFVFWMDAKSRLLRRLEFPPIKQDQAESRLTVNYGDIQSEVRGDVFRLAKLPASAKRVRRFVVPPAESNTKLLNQPIDGIRFTDFDGKDRLAKDLRGRVVVFCWFDRNATSLAALSELQLLHKQLEDERRAVILGVFAESKAAMSNDQLKRLLTSRKITLPVVRDLDSSGRRSMGIGSLPALVAIDAKGVVQLQEERNLEGLGQQVQIVVGKLLAGENLAETYLRVIGNQARAYKQFLAANILDAAGAGIQPAEIAEATQPTNWKLSQIWENRSLKSPGNMVVEESNGRFVVYALDGLDVVRIDQDGKELARRSLVAEGERPVTRIRAGRLKDSGTTLYAGWSNLSQKVHLYDPDWKEVLVYPPRDKSIPHAGIQEVQLVDLDEDGQLELYVGFARDLGVQRVSLDGTRRWSNRSVSSVVSMVPSQDRTGQTFMMVTSDSGVVTPVDVEGREQQPVPIAQRAIHQLCVTSGNNESSTFLGLSSLPTGGLLALGIDGGFREIWSYPLPPGLYRTQVQAVSFADWPIDEDSPGSMWIMVGPDGSVHMISPDGKSFDQFHHGQVVSGAIGFEHDGQAYLLIASPDRIVAYRAERK